MSDGQGESDPLDRDQSSHPHIDPPQDMAMVVTRGWRWELAQPPALPSTFALPRTPMSA